MKTIEEMHDEMVEAAARQRAAARLVIEARVLQAKDCQVSKRELLGLNRRHRTTETPLFESKGLF